MIFFGLQIVAGHFRILRNPRITDWILPLFLPPTLFTTTSTRSAETASSSLVHEEHLDVRPLSNTITKN